MQDSIRVLLFSGARDWGGAEIFLRNLLSGLSSHVEPELLGVDRHVLERIAAGRPGTPVQVVPVVTGKKDFRAMVAHRRAVARAHADVVQVNLPAPFRELYTVLAASTLGCKVVVVEHLPLDLPSRASGALKRVTARLVDAHVAVGTETARTVEQLSGLPPGRIRVIPNGVPAGAARDPSRRPAAPLVVAGIGRLDVQKGFDVLVRAVAPLPQVHLVLVGDGPERNALIGLAEELGMSDRLTVTGWVERPVDHLATVDVLAVPSRFEGLPLGLLEAMHVGLPVVATRVGSIPDAIEHGRTGLLVPPEDAASLSSTLARLASDEELRDRLGRDAERRAREQFSVHTMVRRYEALWAELTEKGRSNGGPSRTRRPRRR